MLRAHLDLDEAGFAEHAEVLRHLRLLEMETLADVSDRARPAAEELDDAEPIGLGEGCEGPDHDEYMNHRAYTRQGICDARIRSRKGHDLGVIMKNENDCYFQ
jgi:hypothetical protein